MRIDGPAELGSLVMGALRGLDLDARVKEYTLLQLWDEVVGEQVAGAAQPEFIREGRMFVVTKSPVWSNELMLYKPDMIARLNKKMGGSVLKDIIFKAGRMPERRKKASEKPIGPIIDDIKLTDEELSNIEVTASAAGGEASDGLKKLLATSLRLEKAKKSAGWTPCKKCGVLQKSASGTCPVCALGK